MNGIDLSNNNTGPVDWYGVDFVFYKATEGANFIDQTQRQWTGHAQLEGPYHFAHPDQNTALLEAQWFLAHAVTGDMWALDVETRATTDPLAVMGPDRLADWCERFYDAVAPHLGANGYHYTFRSYANALWPKLQRPWRWWLATAAGTPNTTHYAGRPVDIEQYASTGGIDRNHAYTPLVTVPPPPPPLEVTDMAAPATCTDTRGRPWVFYRNPNGELWARCGNDKPFTLGGKVTDAIAAIPGPDATIDVYAYTPDQTVWARHADGSGWGAWYPVA